MYPPAMMRFILAFCLHICLRVSLADLWKLERRGTTGGCSERGSWTKEAAHGGRGAAVGVPHVFAWSASAADLFSSTSVLSMFASITSTFSCLPAGGRQ